MKCPQCGRQGRIFRVDESAPEGIVIHYLCVNRQCRARGSEIGSELFRPPEKQGEQAEQAQEPKRPE